MKKNKLFFKAFQSAFIAFFLAIVIYISGCSDSIVNSTVTPNKNQAMTEAQLSSIVGDTIIPPTGAVVYVDLEHLNSPPSGVSGDTGPIGEDIIPYKFTETAVHRFKLDAGAQFTARLVNSAGAVMFTLNNPNDTARVTLPAGNYKLYLTSLLNYVSVSDPTQAVFIQPDLAAITSGGAPPQGGYNKDDLNKLLATKKCVECNLERVQLNNKDLTGADLTRANLSQSFMSYVNLTGATFDHTDWTDAGANNCNFAGAKFITAIVNRTVFADGYFYQSIFHRLNWDRTSFLNGDFRYATFDSGSADGGSLDGSNFSYSTFTNVNLREMSAEHTNFTKVTFSNVYMYEMFLANSTMDSTNYINGCYFQHCTIRGTNIRYSTFTNFRGDASVFDDCIMTGSTITNSGFNGGSLRAAVLINTIWNNVDINAVNMCHQDRTGAAFAGMHYNVDTDCWP